jgi:3-hydroxyacyl-[acyl-carrier-protein] dehydratase
MVVFAGLDRVRFRRVVRPPDVLELELVVDRLRRSIGRGTGRATVNGELAVDGTLTFGLLDGPPA